MNSKFFVHHKSDYRFAGQFDTKEEANTFINEAGFTKLVGLQDTTAKDYVIDELFVNETQRCFVFYHVTASSNVPAIMKNGLFPLRGERSLARGETTTAIYAFPSLEQALVALEDWFGSFFIVPCNCEGECDVNCTKKEIDFTVLTLALPYDAFARHLSTDIDYERVIRIPIPPECIDVIFASEE